MRIFPWIPHLALMMWTTIYSHWWYLIFITLGCQLLKSSQANKLVKIWNPMVNSITSETCGKHVQVETFMFYYGWCPTKTTTLQWVLFYLHIFYTFSPIGVYTRLHIISHYVWNFIFQVIFLMHSKIGWSLNHVLVFLCVWHVLKTWCLQSMEKIKYVEIRVAIFNCFHLVISCPSI